MREDYSSYLAEKEATPSYAREELAESLEREESVSNEEALSGD